MKLSVGISPVSLCQTGSVALFKTTGMNVVPHKVCCERSAHEGGAGVCSKAAASSPSAKISGGPHSDMAHRGPQLESVSCPIGLETLNDPGTTSCGHSFCIKCPVLVKNKVLVNLVEQLEKTRLTAPPAYRCYAGPQDVSCDVCSDRKLKAVKSCLQCVASYCEPHLQPHYDSAVFQRHQLVAPSHTLQENICSEHNELKKMFCRTEQQIICHLCCENQHKGHETVSSASERAQREAQLGAQRHLLLQSLQHKDTEKTSLQQHEQDIRDSAHTALQLSRDSFRDIILLLKTRAKEVEQQIQSEEETELSRVREIQDQVKQELSELKQSLCDLDTLSLTKDHTTFLQLHTALTSHSQGPVPVRGHTEARSPFEEVTRAVSELREGLQLTVEEGHRNISLALSRVQLLTTEPRSREEYSLTPRPLRDAADKNSREKKSKKKNPRGNEALINTPVWVSLLAAEPRSREEFLQYSTDFTLDINTVNMWLSLSDGNRRVTQVCKDQKYLDHPDRFSEWCPQVLSTESVTGRCYWEVKWSGEQARIAVSYRNIQRKGRSGECGFGFNDKSWALVCNKISPSFVYNSVWSKVSGPVGSRIGVFLDHSAGVLSFYNVSKKMRLIYREQTTFTRPLHTGVELYIKATAHFSKQKYLPPLYPKLPKL